LELALWNQQRPYFCRNPDISFYHIISVYFIEFLIIMTNETICFSQLNHMNYAEWALRMEAILICGGFWDLITGDERLEKGAEGEVEKAFKKGRLTVGQRLF
jgi:hypothetical protein